VVNVVEVANSFLAKVSVVEVVGIVVKGFVGDVGRLVLVVVR
jgi:hypothetical protein